MSTYKIFGLAGQFRVIDGEGNKVGVYDSLTQAKVVCLQAGASIEFINCRNS